MSKTENITSETDKKGNVTYYRDGDKVVQIECAEGHTYWRKSQRGRRPEFCPEHTPVDETKIEKVVTVNEDGEETIEIPSPWEGLSEADIAFIETIKDQAERNKFYYYDRELRKNLTPQAEEKDDMQYIAPKHLNTRPRYQYLQSELRLLLNRAKMRAGYRSTVTEEVAV